MFATVVAGAVDSWWEQLGRPDPFVVVEAGAGVGTFARDFMAAGPACLGALRYVLVERSAAQRHAASGTLPFEPPEFVLGPVRPAADGDAEPSPVTGEGPLVTALAELPAGPFTGVVVANELLDNLAFRLLERAGGRWHEVRVTAELHELLVPAAPELAAEADRLAPGAPDGARIPLQHQAAAWLRSALGVLEAGRVVVVDYADDTPSFAGRPWPEWLRTYRSHDRGGHPLDSPGGQDITCEVAVDQLARVRRPDSDRTQADFLSAHGIGDLRAAAADEWRARAGIGDLAAVRARSRAHEADALLDPTGLGAFRVLEWIL